MRRLRALWPRSVFLAEDETDLLLFPPLRSCWALRGQPAFVRLCGWNARRVILGTLNVCTGNRLFLPREYGRAADFQAFLDLIHDCYRGWQVVLLLDEDPAHTAEESVEIAWDYDMDLWWLPKRCPQLNPLDTLWGQGKDLLNANKQYASMDEQADRFLGYLQSLSGQEALHTAGILSGNFWLRHALSKDLCGSA